MMSGRTRTKPDIVRHCPQSKFRTDTDIPYRDVRCPEDRCLGWWCMSSKSYSRHARRSAVSAFDLVAADDGAGHGQRHQRAALAMRAVLIERRLQRTDTID